MINKKKIIEGVLVEIGYVSLFIVALFGIVCFI